MKGVVFHFKNRERAFRFPKIGDSSFSIRSLYQRFGMRTVFVLLFISGLIIGAACSRSFDEQLFSRLDFLFLTDIKSRMDMSVFVLFLSAFAAYFVFSFAVFLCGLSVWGFAATPFLLLFKGFSIGLSSALVFALYQASGIGFYILIILPGAVLYLFILVKYAESSFSLSLRYMRISLFGCEREPMMKQSINRFLKKSLAAFLSSGACAVLDMVLWVLFADRFQF